jgi:hypothetical protein
MYPRLFIDYCGKPGIPKFAESGRLCAASCYQLVDPGRLGVEEIGDPALFAKRWKGNSETMQFIVVYLDLARPDTARHTRVFKGVDARSQ